MFVTEEQARMTKWCPMVRVRWKGSIGPGNRVNPGQRKRFINHVLRTLFPRLHWHFRLKFYRCWASSCMMWRWEGKGSPRGYCGLAGNPLALEFTPAQLDQGAELEGFQP